MKRKWSDINYPPGLGLSRSALRTLDSVESSLKGVERLSAATHMGGAADLASRLERTSGIIAAATIRKVKDAPGGPGVGIVGNAHKEVTRVGKHTLAGISKDLAFGRAYRPHPAFGALSGLARGVSSFSSASRATELANVIGKPKSPGIASGLSGLSGLAPGSPVARNMAAVFDTVLSPTWKNALLPCDKNFSSSTLSGLLDGIEMTNAQARRGVKILSETRRLFGTARRDDVFGILGTSVLRGVLPTSEAIGRGLGGLSEFLSRIDFKALKRAALVREARRPRTNVGFAALNAFDALYMGHPWVADRFLADYLGLSPDADHREALWRVLKLAFERNVTWPARWILLEEERATAYLRKAVGNEAKRVRRDLERPDRVWWRERDSYSKKEVELPPPTRQPEYTLELMMKKAGNPADIVVPRADDRGLVLQMLYVEGTAQDKRVVGWLIAGYELAEIAGFVGWPEVQRFQRKAQRWRENRL